MSAPTNEPPRLPDALHHKLIAVRLQLEAFDRDQALAQAHLRLAVLEREAFRATLAPIEAEILSALGAEPGSRFEWPSMTVVPPRTETEPATA